MQLVGDNLNPAVFGEVFKRQAIGFQRPIVLGTHDVEVPGVKRHPLGGELATGQRATIELGTTGSSPQCHMPCCLEGNDKVHGQKAICIYGKINA